MIAESSTISLVDDDKGFCDAIAWFLRSNGYTTAIYNDASSFLSELSLSDGCALLDLQLGSHDGVDLIKEARLNGYDAPIVIVSGFGTVSSAMRAGHNGAFEFLEKPISNDTLLTVVKRACEAHRTYRQQLETAPPVDRFRLLTEREREVFWLLADGYTTKLIAEQLNISARTAEVHRGRVLEKLQTNRLSEVIRTARVIASRVHK